MIPDKIYIPYAPPELNDSGFYYLKPETQRLNVEYVRGDLVKSPAIADDLKNRALEALERLMTVYLPRNASGVSPFPITAFVRGSFPDYDIILDAVLAKPAIDEVKYDQLEKAFEILLDALTKISKYPRGGIITPGSVAEERDFMIELARVAVRQATRQEVHDDRQTD